MRRTTLVPRCFSAMTLLLAAVALVPALAGGEERPLRVVLPDAPRELDPHLDPTAVGGAILPNLFESLVALDPDGQATPALAVRWERLGDQGWRFELRRGVHFHDGAPLTSADVVASLLRARDNPNSVSRVVLNTVATVTAEGPSAVRLDLNAPDAVILEKLSSVAIVPRGVPERITKPVGTGPYQLVESIPGQSLTLRAFDGYWGSRPHEKLVEVLFERDRDAALKRLLANQVDIVSSLGPESVQVVEERNDLWVESAIGSTVLLLGLNATKPPFDDPVVREAADFAIDRQALAHDVFRNYARPAGQLVNNLARGYSPTVPPVVRDLKRAKALLATVANPGSLEIALEFKGGNEALAGAVQRQLAEAGFRVTLQPRPWTELLPRMLDGKIQAALFIWRNEPEDAGFTFDLIVHGQSPSTAHIGIASPQTDRLIVACHTVLDPESRFALLRSIAELVAQRRTMLPLIWSMDLYGVRRNVQWEALPSAEIRLATISRATR